MLRDLVNVDGTLSTRMPIYIREHGSEQEVKDMLNCQGKNTTQKIFNYLYHDGCTPVCESCGKKLIFSNFKSGYVECSCGGSSKVTKSISVSNLEKLEKDGAVQISQSKDYDSGSCTSSILMKAGIISDDELLRRHGFDPEKWSISSASSSNWEQQSKDGVINLVSSKITVKQKTAESLSAEDIKKVFNDITGYKPKNPYQVQKLEGDESLLVIPIADFHYGLLSEVGPTEDRYDTEIAEQRLHNFINNIIERTHKKTDKVLLTIGNDFFNADTLNGTTAKGTPQDQEMGYIALFKKGLELCIDVITKLEKSFKDITIASVQANHDKVTSYFLMSALYQRYENSKTVHIKLDSAESPRMYFSFGENLLGFGHDTNIKKAPELMACEARDTWYKKHKTFFIAHLHTEEVFESNSVVVRRLPILSSASAWAESKGFKNTGPRGQAFLFDSKNGLTDILNYYV